MKKPNSSNRAVDERLLRSVISDKSERGRGAEREKRIASDGSEVVHHSNLNITLEWWRRRVLWAGGGRLADSRRVPATPTDRGSLTESARAAEAVPALRQIAWLKSKVRALIA